MPQDLAAIELIGADELDALESCGFQELECGQGGTLGQAAQHEGFLPVVLGRLVTGAGVVSAAGKTAAAASVAPAVLRKALRSIGVMVLSPGRIR